MNIVVTGGAGFIGSHVIDRLLSEGFNVTNIDNFDSFYDSEIKEANIYHHFDYPHYKCYKVDIRNFKRLDEIIDEDTDAIIHLAAKAGVRPSIENPAEYQDVNVNGTQNLLELARKKNIEQFVFASSSSVYGKNPNVPWSEADHVLQPISPYASSKVSGELMGHVYSHLYNIRFLALRFFTVYGPRQRPDLAIHKFSSLMSNNDQIKLYGDGSTRRDYTYVDDIVDGIMKALNYRDTMYEIINLGNNKTVELHHLVTSIENALGVEADKFNVEEQPGDVKQTWANITKAKALLGYEPSHSLNKGLAKFAKWFETEHMQIESNVSEA